MSQQISDLLNDYLLKAVDKTSKASIEAYTEVIDEESEKCFQNIRDETPEREGNLKSSLVKTKINEPNKYGYKIEYIGYNQYGIAYSLIARALNNGFIISKSKVSVKATRHITRSVRKLKGMDDRINERFFQKINN